MRHLWLLVGLLGLLMSGPVWAASYQKIDGTIVDPIIACNSLEGSCFSHPYDGPNLQEGSNLSGANLSSALLQYAALGTSDLSNAFLGRTNLSYADLSGSNLSFAVLRKARLVGANLENADLSFSDFYSYNYDDFVSVIAYANVSGANFSGANLTNLGTLASTTGSAIYDLSTIFVGSNFDPVAAGWNLVPEPSTALLLGLGLVGLAVRRRS